MPQWSPRSARCLTLWTFLAEDHIFFASDYSAREAVSGVSEIFRNWIARTDISVSAKWKILSENTKRFYRLSG
jgi:predicted TIM-barrel fold metal-dependent hydrolase